MARGENNDLVLLCMAGVKLTEARRKIKEANDALDYAEKILENISDSSDPDIDRAVHKCLVG